MANAKTNKQHIAHECARFQRDDSDGDSFLNLEYNLIRVEEMKIEIKK